VILLPHHGVPTGPLTSPKLLMHDPGKVIAGQHPVAWKASRHSDFGEDLPCLPTRQIQFPLSSDIVRGCGLFAI
jgi:hypothetical protein